MQEFTYNENCWNKPSLALAKTGNDHTSLAGRLIVLEVALLRGNFFLHRSPVRPVIL